MEDFFCPKHPETKLWNVLKGGAGYCARCFTYVQAAGIPEPVRDVPQKTEAEWRSAKRKAAKAAKPAKATKTTKTATPEPTAQPVASKPPARLIKRKVADAQEVTTNAQ